MNRIEISEDDFNREEIVDTCGSESKRYLRNDKIYKFIHKFYRLNREVIIEQINKDNLINVPQPYEIITQDGEFAGYTMEYLNGFYSLCDYFRKYEYVYSKRFNSCMQLIKALNDLIEKGYQHYDLHTSNVMICDNEGKIIDLDSMCNPKVNVELNNSSYKFCDDLFGEKDIISTMKKRLLNSICAIMFTKNIYEPLNMGGVKLLNEFSGDTVMSSYILDSMSMLIDKGFSLEDILSSLTEEKIEKYHELRIKK